MSANIFISAGEASGEHYGALLISVLKARLKDQGCASTFFGMGGERMVAEGLDRVVRSEDMAVMGITEVILHLPRIYAGFRKLKRAIRQRRPDVAVLIDFPDIHFKLAKELHRLGVPVVFFVSPQLWAWKKGRIKLVQKYVTRMLVIFPFEAPFYRERGVDAEFVGHPLAELPLPVISRAEFAAQNGLDPAAAWIGLLPGSRPKEIRDNLPEMLAAAEVLIGLGSLQGIGERTDLKGHDVSRAEIGQHHEGAAESALKGHDFSRAKCSQKGDGALAPAAFHSAEETIPQGLKPASLEGAEAARLKPCPFKASEPFGAADAFDASNPIGFAPSLASSTFQFLLPLAPTLNAAQRAEVQTLVAAHAAGLPITLVDDARAALYHARASIVASGTATVEAALIGNPFVVVYRVSPLTYAIAKRVVTVEHVAMANLIAGKRVVPELIQNDFTAAKIVEELLPLLPDGPPRESMMQDLKAIGTLLRTAQDAPGGESTGAIERVAAVTLELLEQASPTQGAPAMHC